MTYTQIISPKLTTVGNAGWCLWFVEQDFGVPHLYASAEDAWNACHLPHSLEQPPNATVPVYWTYFDASANIEFGHIAIWVPGRGIFSSPFNTLYGNQWFASVQAVTDRINQIKGANARYLGWSEDLAGEIIVKQGGYIMDEEDAKEIGYRLGLHREPENDQVWRGLVGKKPSDVSVGVRGGSEWLGQNHIILKAYPEAEAQIADLKAQLAASGGYTPADRATAQETNSIVKQIWAKITSVFK